VLAAAPAGRVLWCWIIAGAFRSLVCHHGGRTYLQRPRNARPSQAFAKSSLGHDLGGGCHL